MKIPAEVALLALHRWMKLSEAKRSELINPAGPGPPSLSVILKLLTTVFNLTLNCP